MHVLMPGSEAFSDLSANAFGAFGAIVILAYYLGKRIAESGAKYVFIRMTVVLIFVKMFIGVGLVVYHVRNALPDDKLFILPFLIIYLIFTIFEIYVLEKLGRIQPVEKSR